MPGLARSTCLADIGEGRDAAAAVWAELAIILGTDFALEHLLHIAARLDPGRAQFGEALVDVDQDIVVGIRPAAVIDADGGVVAMRSR